MTNLLIKIFSGKNGPGTPEGRRSIGRLSGIVGITSNLILFAAKLIIGTLSGSLSVTADAMNNLSDASSSIITFIGFKLSEKPADEDHPFGHARFEYLSGLAVAAIIMVVGFELAKGSFQKILNPEAVALSLPFFAVLGLSIAVKLWLSLFNGKLGRMIDSGALLATAADSRNDVIATAAVLLAAAVEWITGWRVDGYMGFAVALFILYSSINLAKETISPLLGEAASPELRGKITRLVDECPDVLGYHDLMVHDYGPGQRFASMHVEMDRRQDPLLCHEIIDNLERSCLKQHNVHLVIHYDPVAIDDPHQQQLQAAVAEILSGIDPRLSMHDFRMVASPGHTNLIFDIALPDDMSDRRREIKHTLDQELSQRYEETLYTVVTFDPGAFNRE